MDAFLDELTWEQLQELRAYAAIEGFGEDRDDARFAYMFAVLCAKFGVEADPEEFHYIPEEDDEEQELTPEQQVAIMASALGAVRS